MRSHFGRRDLQPAQSTTLATEVQRRKGVLPGWLRGWLGKLDTAVHMQTARRPATTQRESAAKDHLYKAVRACAAVLSADQ